MPKTLVFPQSNELTQIFVDLTSFGKGGIEFDFAALCNSTSPVQTVTVTPEFVPKKETIEEAHLLSYEGVERPVDHNFFPTKIMSRMTGKIANPAM